MIDLRAQIRETLRTSGIADPAGIAEAVYGHIPAKSRGDALLQALPVIVREVIGQERMRSPLASADTITHPKAARSWKVSAVRDTWRRALRNRIHVADGQWKFLADCTRDDLLFAAGERARAAERSAAIAQSYAALADLLDEHDVKTVDELPEDVLAAVIGAAA